MSGMTIHQLKVGDQASAGRTISEADVYAFGGIIGDMNPVHYNEEIAKKGIFKKRVAHGMLTASLLSGVIAQQLPGFGSIFLGLTVKFTKPVFFGDTVTATVTVKELKVEKNIVVLGCECRNQAQDLVLEGEATIMAPRS